MEEHIKFRDIWRPRDIKAWLNRCLGPDVTEFEVEGRTPEETAELLKAQKNADAMYERSKNSSSNTGKGGKSSKVVKEIKVDSEKAKQAAEKKVAQKDAKSEEKER